jgi:hypothetical protein
MPKATAEVYPPLKAGAPYMAVIRWTDGSVLWAQPVQSQAEGERLIVEALNGLGELAAEYNKNK